MTEAARRVLEECKLALADFEAGLTTVYWRTRFVALMTILRSVGFVLNTIDRRNASEPGKQAIDEAWERLKASKPEPSIFHGFIDAERYQTAHLCVVNARAITTLRLGAAWFNTSTGETGGDPSGPTTYDYLMRAGAFEGQDPRSLARDAIAFWGEYLDSIERSTT